VDGLKDNSGGTSAAAEAAKPAYNCFFGDSLLFRAVAKMQASLMPELAELGAWAAGPDAREKARAAHIFPPRLSAAGAGGAALPPDLHPAYHGLLTRARHAGLASAVAAAGFDAKGFSRRARAGRLLLLAQAECAPLQDMAHSAAAYLAVAALNPLLAAALKPLLAGRIHDPSRRFFSEKQSIALSFALGGKNAAILRAAPAAAGQEPAARTAFAAALGAPAADLSFYQIWGECRAALGSLSDGFIIRGAEAGGAAQGGPEAAGQLFFVSAFKAPGQGNGLEFMPFDPGLPLAAPCCGLRFAGSLALKLGESPERQAQALELSRNALLSDYCACAAGLLRGGLSRAVAWLHNGGGGAPQPGRAFYLQAERALADAALDVAAAQILALRLAEAEDKAADNAREAAFAAVMRPALAFELWRLMPVCTDFLARLSGEAVFGQAENGFANRLLLPDFYAEDEGAAAEEESGPGGYALAGRLRRNLRRHDADFLAKADELLAALPAAMRKGAGQVLHLAAERSAEDEGAVFFMTDRLIYSCAAALLYGMECGNVAAAYTESRLGGARQSGYGSLSLRHNAEFILEALYPGL